jgi:bifunctional NMN adenylyltransferase/nudix hydrolase
MTEFQTAVLIGRFQPFHNAHFALLQHALAAAPRCVVVLGSSYQARTPKNPFTWVERAEMIHAALPESDRPRVRFLPMRDYYNLARWTRAVRDGVAPHTEAGPVALVGHFKDASSEYLRGFSGWEALSIDKIPGPDGTQLRNTLFEQKGLDTVASQVPPSTLGFLTNWLKKPFFTEMTHEWQLLRGYKASWSTAPYPPILVTADSVVRCQDHVLLVHRGQAPGLGLQALPGGFMEQHETVLQAALRELAEETQLVVPPGKLRASAVFDHPDRSLRGRVITHGHYFELDGSALPPVQAGDDAQAAYWVPITRLSDLEECFLDDHFHILDHFLGLLPA